MQPPAPVVRMMDEAERPSSRSSRQAHTAISKLKHSNTQGRPTKSATRSGGQGQKARATPLIPGKPSVGREGEEEEDRAGRIGLDVGKLHSILRGYGEYPTKYR